MRGTDGITTDCTLTRQQCAMVKCASGCRLFNRQTLQNAKRSPLEKETVGVNDMVNNNKKLSGCNEHIGVMKSQQQDSIGPMRQRPTSNDSDVESWESH